MIEFVERSVASQVCCLISGILIFIFSTSIIMNPVPNESEEEPDV